MTADVQISMDDKQLIFQCKDTGIGMDKDFLQHLYEPYVRKENDVHEIAGTGLGMAITHKLIDLMKGAMEVESRIGVGTNIRITLPIRLADGEEDKVSYDVRQTFGEIRYVEEFLGKTVLLVEDNEINREIATELIQETGLKVECAANGREAVEMVKKHETGYYEMIFMDIQMPIMNGYEATRQIRQLPDLKLAEISIIAMTANAFIEDVKKAGQAGMNGHLTKPLQVGELMRILYEYCGK